MTKKDKAPLRERFKNTLTKFNDSEKQRILTWLCYVAVISLAILTSSLTLFFDTENFNASVFFCSLCFNLAIAILMLILSLRDGRLSNETRKSGELYEIKKEQYK